MGVVAAEARFTEAVHVWARVQGGGAQIVQHAADSAWVHAVCRRFLASCSSVQCTLSAGARGVAPR
jgi:hypothetical protein